MAAGFRKRTRAARAAVEPLLSFDKYGAEVAEEVEVAFTTVKAAAGCGHNLGTFHGQQEAGVADRGWAVVIGMRPLMADHGPESPDCWDAVITLVRSMQHFQANRAELLGPVAGEAPLDWWDKV